jgi:phosphoesterase RecJ-like protein
MHSHREKLYKIQQALQQAKRVVVISHEHPDGDTLGASLAFSHWLQIMNKDHQLFCNHPVPEYLSWLPEDKFTSDSNVLNHQDVDVLVVLDISDLKLSGVKEQIEKIDHPVLIINIDHHIANLQYGGINLVLPESSSTSEMIYRLFDYLNVPITPDVATHLLTGVMTDTTGLTNPAANQDAFEVAAALVMAGGKMQSIVRGIFHNKTIPVLKLWGECLTRLKYNHDKELATTVIWSEDLVKYNLSEDDVSGLTNFLSSVIDAPALLVLRRKEDNMIKGSFRTTHNDIDVAEMARAYGGGGHKKAAAFTVDGTIRETSNEWVIELSS